MRKYYNGLVNGEELSHSSPAAHWIEDGVGSRTVWGLVVTRKNAYPFSWLLHKNKTAAQ
jgi:hypothetical protein